MRRKLVACMAAGAVLAAAGTSVAEVEIRTNDGSVSVKGELLSFTDGVYELETAVGVMRIPGDIAVCVGEECPAPPVPTEFKIKTASAIGGDLIMRLIGGYASANDANVFIDFDTAQRLMNVSLQDESEEKLADIALSRGAADDAFDALLSGDSQVIVTSRRPSEDERTSFAAAGLGEVLSEEREVVLALDGFAVLVSSENDARSIAVEEIATVFSGQTTNWADLGGPNAPIRVIMSNADAEAADYFERNVLGPLGLSLAANIERLDTDAAVADAVEADPLAIGLASVVATEDSHTLPVRLACGLTSEPSFFSVKAEEYPLSRRLFLYARGDQLPTEAERLIDYSRTAAGQLNVAEVGLVDQGVVTRNLSDLGGRLATALVEARDVGGVVQLRNMALELIDAEQLSTTLRFRSASAQLDSKALQDVERLATLFSSPDYQDKEILLAGFTDSVGRLDLNLVLANRRAEQV
ncbi:MAG: substrate-binding domain-containing protein, partial [Pseudomonadota bacterium]